MRIFIGIDLSDQTRRSVAEYIGELRREFPHVRTGWERPEKLHLTLKFLGDITEEELEKVKLAVEKAALSSERFDLEISGTGVFPNTRKPKILWLGIGGKIEKLKVLYESIESECEAAGFKRELREFKPHLTIGRIREPEKGSELAETHLKAKFEPARFEVSELVIFHSKLQPTGSVYERYFKYKLSSIS